LHRDSVGTEMEITPGAVNWMTAGKGVVHSERTPEYLRTTDKSLHGLQIWVALPKEKENIDPSFVHIEAKDIPEWEQDNVTIKLIAGEAFGKKSPVPVYSPLFLIEIKSTAKATLNIGKDIFGESALYILEGEIINDGNIYASKQILVAKESGLCQFEMSDNCTVYIFGGEPFSEEHFIYWNFVHSDKAVIEKAKQDWIDQKFPKVPNETEFVPLPQPKIR
jgi:redox-sensitive bicupin YhaK (pirin superfamily)